ncbi:hypothetical protein GBA52_019569 [Prunus armeniaca]|nr:hypothetical protein GBA52_019569 [Prunus armeniaca]
MRGFLKLRVEINTSIPLSLGFWLSMRQTERSWICLKYEGLIRFCHICGRLRQRSFEEKAMQPFSLPGGAQRWP